MEGRSFWLDFLHNIPLPVQYDIEEGTTFAEVLEAVDSDKAFRKYRDALKKKKLKTLEASDDLVDCSPYAWKQPLDWPQKLENIYVESHGGATMKNDRNYQVYASILYWAREDRDLVSYEEEDEFRQWKKGLYGGKQYNEYRDFFEFINSSQDPQEFGFSRSDVYEPDNFHRTPLHVRI